MDLFIVACGLRVMYEIHLKFSVSNEALACLRVGRARGERREQEWLIPADAVAPKRP